MIEINTVCHGDCLEVMKDIPDKSVDMVLTDPPYGKKIDTWDDGTVDIKHFIDECYRVLKDDKIIVVFGMFPTLNDWYNELKRNFVYREHISWIKRQCIPSIRLSRTHENILIFSKGKCRFNKTKGKYEDVKVPLLVTDLTEIKTIQRHIASLRQEIKTGITPMKKRITKCNSIYSRLQYRDHIFSPENVNFSSAWSFLPENQRTYNKGNIDHATVKPTLLIERLIELCSFENDSILDPFAGSGTTALGCIRTNRNYILIEKEQKYIDIINKRIRDETAQLKLAL